MKKILLDSCIFIDFTRTGGGIFTSLIEEAIEKNYQLVTSAVVVGEVWVGKSLVNPLNLALVETIFSDEIKIYPLTTEIAKRAGELVRNHQCTIDDAFIAATALEVKAELCTLNTKHFSDIPGLTLWKKK